MAQRGRARRDLGPDCLVDPTSDKVSCRLCQNPQRAESTWIRRSNWTGHLQSKTHREAVAAREASRTAATICAQSSQADTTPLPTVPRSASDAVRNQGPSFSGSIDPTEDINGVSAADFIFTSEEQDTYFRGQVDASSETERLEALLHAELQRLSLTSLEKELRRDEQMEYEPEPDASVRFRSEATELSPEEGDEEDLEAYLTGIPSDRHYPPYGSKTMFLIQCLINIPRFRIPVSLLRMILWVMQEARARDVPSLRACRQLEVKLRARCGVTTTQHASDLGHVFYTNSIMELICKDLAHPDLAQNINIYPDETPGPISEFSQARYLLDLPRSELTPMFYGHGKHFFVNELCRLEDGRIVIPRIWVTRSRRVYAHCNTVHRQDMDAECLYIENRETLISADLFRDNIFDLMAHVQHSQLTDLNGAVFDATPNPDRKIAMGEDLITLCTPLFCDDVSGAQSKQYQKHINVYTQDWSLPSRFQRQDSSVRFISTSPTAGSCEQLGPILEAVKASRIHPTRTYNAATHRFCCVRLLVPCLPADNPQHSEEASHAGVNANCKCRKCKKGGPTEVRESDDGYDMLYHTNPHKQRTVEDTRKVVEKQLTLASTGVGKHVTDLQTQEGVKDKIASYWIEKLVAEARRLKAANRELSQDEISQQCLAWLSTQTSCPMNPLLNVPNLDPNRDTPIELLHTWLLGVVKYVWHNLHTSWTDAQRDLFAIRLQETDTDGLNIPPLRAAYMVQYRNNLIGKHFKSLSQAMAFKIYGLVSTNQLTLVRTLGELGAVLWITTIDDMKQHTDDLAVLVGNLLDAFANIDPNRIIAKQKLQVLPHVVDDIPRFGPAPRYSTEAFESFNAIFRLCSVYSNHQAPSRDIALKMAGLECLRHIISGGYWEEADGSWTRAGDNVLATFRHSPLLQQHLGMAVRHVNPTPGDVTLPAQDKRKIVHTRDTLAFSVPVHHRIPTFTPDSSWTLGTTVAANSCDICHVGSWIMVHDHKGDNAIGLIKEILVRSGGPSTTLITFEKFSLHSEHHRTLGMPTVTPVESGKCSYEVVTSASILFILNVQHDCEAAECSLESTRPVFEERQETNQRLVSVQHNLEYRRYIINSHALHNANLLRRHLPKDFLKPTSLYANRRQRHDHLAAGLRISQAARRTAAQEKRNEAARAKAKASEASEAHLDDSIMAESAEEAEAEAEGGVAAMGRGKRRRVE